MSDAEIAGNDENDQPPRETGIDARLLASDDLDALIAFALYYKQRRDWENAFYAKKGSYPSLDQAEIYDMAWSPARLAVLKQEANEILRAYANDVSRNAMREYRNLVNEQKKSDRFAIILAVIGIIAAVMAALNTFRVSGVFDSLLRWMQG